MADKENRQQQGNFNVNGVAAGALASVAAAFFTSRLGVAGTLVGAAVTSLVITVGSAVTKASLERAAGRLSEATTKISGLPTTAARGRRATQQVRVPGSPGPEPEDEPRHRADDHDGHAPTEGTDDFPSRRSRRERRGSGPLGGLGAALSNFGRLPAGRRRRVLAAGALAGVVATAISLFAITGIEAVIGQPLSSVGRTDTSESASVSSAESRTSLGSLGQSVRSSPQPGEGDAANPESQEAPAVEDQQSGDGGLFGGDGSDSSGSDSSETPAQEEGEDVVVPAPEEPVEQPAVPEEPVAEPTPEEEIVPEVAPESEPVQPEGEAAP